MILIYFTIIKLGDNLDKKILRIKYVLELLVKPFSGEYFVMLFSLEIFVMVY